MCFMYLLLFKIKLIFIRINGLHFDIQSFSWQNLVIKLFITVEKTTVLWFHRNVIIKSYILLEYNNCSKINDLFYIFRLRTNRGTL